MVNHHKPFVVLATSISRRGKFDENGDKEVECDRPLLAAPGRSYKSSLP